MNLDHDHHEYQPLARLLSSLFPRRCNVPFNPIFSFYSIVEMGTTMPVSNRGHQEGTKVIEEWRVICNLKKAESQISDKRHRGEGSSREFRTAGLLTFCIAKLGTRLS